MKKAIILVSCFLSAFAAHGQEPAPSTQEWRKWAFQQIPDHRDIAEVDAEAFSVDFYTLLKIALSADPSPNHDLAFLERLFAIRFFVNDLNGPFSSV